jgi:hypothetical protein
LSIHGRFRVGAGGIEPLRGVEADSAASSAQEAQNAAVWYAKIRADSFGV